MRRATLALILTLTACSGSTNTDVDGGADVVDPSTEAPAGGHTAASATTANAAKGVSELFVQEDPTINVSDTAAQNAQNVQSQVQSKVSSACPGASIQLSASTNTVTVDFGSSCTLSTLGTVSGTVSAAVAQPMAGEVEVTFTFTSLVVNGLAIDGTFAATTSSGTSFTVNANLTANGDTLVLTAATFTLDSNGSGVTIGGSGTLTTSTATGPETLTFNAVHHEFGSCYANAGSIGISKTATTTRGHSVTTTETVTFSSTSPTTGQAQLTVGNSAPITVSLPGYGQCGSGVDAG